MWNYVHNRNNSRGNSHTDGNANNRRRPVNADQAGALRLQSGQDGPLEVTASLSRSAAREDVNGQFNGVPDKVQYGTDYDESNDSVSGVYAPEKGDETTRRGSYPVPNPSAFQAGQMHLESASNRGRGANDAGGQFLGTIEQLTSINGLMHSNFAPQNESANGNMIDGPSSYPTTSDGIFPEPAPVNLQGQGTEPRALQQEQRILYSDYQPNITTVGQKQRKSPQTPRRESTETESSHGYVHRQDLVHQYEARETRKTQMQQSTQQKPRPGKHASPANKQPKSNGVKPGHSSSTRTVNVQESLKEPPNAPSQFQTYGQSQNGSASAGEYQSPGPHAMQPQPQPPAYHQPPEARYDRNWSEPPPTDYPSDVLMRKHYLDLKNEPFDKDPGAPQSTLSEAQQNAPLPDRLDHCLDTSEPQQKYFFAGLLQAEWEECAPWFMQQFQHLNEQIVQKRREKRQIALQLEDEISNRFDAVQGEITALGGALDDMKRNGGALLDSGTPKRKR